MIDLHLPGAAPKPGGAIPSKDKIAIGRPGEAKTGPFIHRKVSDIATVVVTQPYAPVVGQRKSNRFSIGRPICVGVIDVIITNQQDAITGCEGLGKSINGT